jgi:phosphoheptose isomerase
MEKEEAEKRRIAEEKRRLSAERTTEASMKKSLNDEKIKKVFERVVKALGVDDDINDDGEE